MKRIAALVGALTLIVTLMSGPPALAGANCTGKVATIVGTSGDDSLHGTPKDDVIVGRGGNDWIQGFEGDDLICGGGGRDDLNGGHGNDRLFGGAEGDYFQPGNGNDFVQTGPGRFNSLWGSFGDDVYRGHPDAVDSINYRSAREAVVVDLAAGVATGWGNDTLEEIEIVNGSAFGDELTGDEYPNSLLGNGGNDTLVGGGGGIFSGRGYGMDMFARADVLTGGDGDDELIGSSDYDAFLVFDAPRPMTIDLAAGSAQGEGTDSLAGFEGVITSYRGDTVFGNDEDNAFAIAGHAVLVDGRGGNDLVVALYGFTGNQESGAVIDLIDGTMEAAGTTQLVSIENAWGTRLADMIRGTDGPNEINGRGGNDEIYGLGGDDALRGGPGFDLLDGGAGTDSCASGENATACEG